MAANLTKGQRTAIDSSIGMALVGLGWDSNKYDGGYPFDLDITAFVLGANGKIQSDSDFIFYNNMIWNDRAIWLTADDLSGDNSAEGDDEQIFIDFTKLPSHVDKIVIGVTIHDAVNRRQNFGQVSNAYVRVAKVQNEFDVEGETVIQFDLEEEFSIETAIVAAEIYRKNGEWKFNAVGAGYQGGLNALCRNYGVNTTSD